MDLDLLDTLNNFYHLFYSVNQFFLLGFGNRGPNVNNSSILK